MCEDGGTTPAQDAGIVFMIFVLGLLGLALIGDPPKPVHRPRLAPEEPRRPTSAPSVMWTAGDDCAR